MYNFLPKSRKDTKMLHSKAFYKTNKIFKYSFIITFLFLCTSESFAQRTDTTSSSSNKQPTTNNQQLTTNTKPHSPKKAAWLSTALPGLGQVYNKKYWKVPVIYAGFGALAYSFQFNQSHYVKYRNAYRDRLTIPPIADNYPLYSDATLEMLQKYYHRYRDLSVIGIAALYLLNIVDASVDAHMFTFDVSDDLTLQLHPTLINTANVNHYTTGIGLNIKF